jgi:hypothetical protein
MTATCKFCGEPMPEGEEMFNYHGYSGDCPKPPLAVPVCAFCQKPSPDGNVCDVCKAAYSAGRQEGWEARRDADIQLVTELCFMAGVKKVIIGNEDLLGRIRALTPSPEPQKEKL